ncbi:putative acyltransferase CST26 [Favolaschia claudopus]|uniref:Acyltransferase CST26 n=1 Tax=Favolaschia claudopus TaxID=2862362 RepID=A0AAW0EI68_9AGAR
MASSESYVEEKTVKQPPTTDNSRSKSADHSPDHNAETDVFEEQPGHDFHYKTLSWQFVSLLMIAEIVSNGMLSLPSALAVVGIVPAVILIIFFGVFALYTAKLLIDFKLNHPGVHNMGDAGFVLGGQIPREILSAGTIIFAIFGTGSELLSGQQALSTLSNNGLCAMYLLLIFSAATLLVALPRTLDRVGWLGLFSVCLITISGVVAMIGAGINPVPGRVLNATVSTSFYQAFLAITNPVFAYAGHFMFFILISEMKQPADAMKAAWCLQGFATVFYVVFAVVIYVYIGNTVASPALLSLPEKWSKATFAIALGNFLIAGGLYSHTAAKIVFVRWFRHTKHMYTHTILGWIAWIGLCFAAVAVAFILAIAVPIFSYLIGIAASLFASWYTYGIAGFFWFHDSYHFRGGWVAVRKRPAQAALAAFTILLGAFVCVAGTYVSIKLIVDAYEENLIHTLQLCLLPILPLPFKWSRTLYAETVRYTKRAFGCLLVLMCQWFAPTKLIISFEREGKGRLTQEEIDRIVKKNSNGEVESLDLPTKFVFIANHQVYADWWYGWCLTYYIGPQGVHDSVYITLKKSLRWVPILGWAMQFYNFIFLARSWVSDRLQLSSHLSALGKAAKEQDNPLVFFLYPEGTVVSKDTRPISKKFADKMGIDDMTNMLLPRSTGLLFSLRSLAPRIPDLKMLDVTTVYPGIPPMGYGQSWYTLRSIFLHGVPPPAIHYHLRLFSMNDVPIGDLSKTDPSVIPDSTTAAVEVEIPEDEKAAFDLWLRELWHEKDNSITKWFEQSSFSKTRNEIPLRLRRGRDVLDAFGFFLPAVAGYMWSRIKK